MAKTLGIIRKPSFNSVDSFVELINSSGTSGPIGYDTDRIKERFQNEVLAKWSKDFVRLFVPSSPNKYVYMLGYAIPNDESLRIHVAKGYEYLSYFPFAGVFGEHYLVEGITIYDAYDVYNLDQIYKHVPFSNIHIYRRGTGLERFHKVCSHKPSMDITKENCITAPIAVANRLYQEYLAVDNKIRKFSLDCHPHGW